MKPGLRLNFVNTTDDVVQIENAASQWHFREQEAVRGRFDGHVFEMDGEGERCQRVDDVPGIFEQGDVVAGVQAYADEFGAWPAHHLGELPGPTTLVILHC